MCRIVGIIVHPAKIFIRSFPLGGRWHTRRNRACTYSRLFLLALFLSDRKGPGAMRPSGLLAAHPDDGSPNHIPSSGSGYSGMPVTNRGATDLLFDWAVFTVHSVRHRGKGTFLSRHSSAPVSDELSLPAAGRRRIPDGAASSLFAGSELAEPRGLGLS